MSWLTGLVVLTFAADLSWAAGWGYEGSKGPSYWHQLFPQACSGKHQSPIDIRTEQTMYNPDLKDFAIWYDPPRPGSSMTVLNNGHSVQMSINGEFFVSNGGLPNVYKTAQLHFHWGHANHHGSEHLIDGRASPLEMHIVNYNHDLYSDIGAAVKERQGLAVLGVMFEITNEDNEDLEPILEAMEQVIDPEEGNQVEIEPVSLRTLLPHDITRYFRYNGSLTTPGCFESVVWTVFDEPQTISHRQISKFRQQLQMRSHGGGHKRRSTRRALPAKSSERRRERRALQVLEELGLNSEEQERFRRELTEKKQHAEALAAKMDEENAGESHRRTLDAVHDSVESDDDDEMGRISEVEIEFIQEKMVNNFRPVQPLNGRLVYRSFKLRESHGKRRHHHSGHSKENHKLPDKDTIRERLKQYESTGAASTSVVSFLVVILPCLVALFL